MSLGGEETVVGSGTHRAEALAEGDRVGRYVISHLLGAGGMGVVYAAHDPELERRIAIKLLHLDRSGASGSEGYHRRLLREAQALARLSHPNVLGVHDVGEHEGRVFLAMELVEGVTLSQWSNAQPRSRAEVLAVFRQAGLGLAAAHEVGLVHRDFKPDNVMISPDPQTELGVGRVRVMDFGLARGPIIGPSAEHPLVLSTPSLELLAEAANGSIERTGGATGTPAYMAPEQHLGLEIDARTDQFAFCVALWELLYGQRPFIGTSLAQLAVLVTEGTITEPPRGAEVPGWIRRVLERGLARVRTDRYATMTELLAALARDPTRRRRRLAILGGAAVLAGGAVLARQASIASTRTACERHGDEIAAVWNDDVATGLARAFATTGLAHASTTAERVQPRISAWTERWSQLRVDACVAAQVDASITPAAGSLREACLDARREELAVLVEVLGEAERDVVNHAERSVLRLSRLDDCVDDTRLAASAKAFAGTTPEAVAPVRRALVRSTQLELAGRYDAAIAAAQEARTLAESLGAAGLAAEARLRHAIAIGRSGDYELAATQLEEAYYAAGEAEVDEIALDAATQLVQVLGMRLGRYTQGLEWARHAEMLLGRLELQEDFRAATLASYLGNLQRARDDLAAAKLEHERSLALRERWFGADHPEVAVAVLALAVVATDAGDYVEAERLLRRSEELLVTTYGPDSIELSPTYTSFCNLYVFQGDYRGALPHCQRALTIREAALPEDHPEVTAALNNLANAYVGLGDYAGARVLLERCVKIREDRLGPDHPDLANALNNLGIIEMMDDHYDASLQLLARALTIREHSLPPDHFDIARTLVNVADVHNLKNESTIALGGYQRAADILERTRGKDDPELGRALSGVGGSLLLLGRPDEAVEPLERALALRKPGEGDPLGRCEVHVRLADALWRTRRDRTRARELVTQADAICAEAGARGDEPRKEIAMWLRKHPAAAIGER